MRKDLLYSTGNYTQYLVINYNGKQTNKKKQNKIYNGKESKKEIYIHICVYI